MIHAGRHPFDRLLQRQVTQRSDWAIGVNQNQIVDLARIRSAELKAIPRTVPLSTGSDRIHRIAIAETTPENFLAAAITAGSYPCAAFLCNPNWGDREWQQIEQMIQPDRIWGSASLRMDPKQTGIDRADPWHEARSHLAPGLYIPTGGSSGQLRFAHHTWETIVASIDGTWDYFDHRPIDSLCVLPLYHVSGLMQFFRSLVTQGTYIHWDWKQLEQGQFPDVNLSSFFLSLVPTQLQRLLPYADRLQPLRAILLGGAPAGADLLAQARTLELPIAPTYGMTETASQVATLKPEAFHQGQSGVGKPLPHAVIRVVDEQGNDVAAGTIGQVLIRARSQMLGYFPPQTSGHSSGDPSGQRQSQHHELQRDRSQGKDLRSQDLGYFDAEGFLHILGRSNDTIISGGENIYPAEVEAAIRATQGVQDVAVLGIPDRRWGQIVVALYVPRRDRPDLHHLQHQLAHQIARYKQPKKWIAVDTLPRNLQGKINRNQLFQLAIAANPDQREFDPSTQV